MPERATLYFDFIANNTPDVADKHPFRIIKNAFLEMPNLLNWLREKMPEQYNY